MTLTLYGLKTCDTCTKALKALSAAGQTVTFIDIRAEADLPALLPVWLAALGPDALINTRSTTWRGLDDSQRAAAPLALLTARPTLIKRPVIAAPNGLHVGWSAATQSALLSGA